MSTGREDRLRTAVGVFSAAFGNRPRAGRVLFFGMLVTGGAMAAVAAFRLSGDVVAPRAERRRGG